MKGQFIPIKRGRLTFLLASALVISTAMSVALVFYVKHLAENRQKDMMSYMVDAIAEDCLASINDSKARGSIEKSYWAQVDVIEGVISDVNINKMSLAQKSGAVNFYNNLKEISDARELFMVDSTGTLTMSIYEDRIGQNLVDKGLFTRAQMDELIGEARKMDGERHRISIDRPDGRLFFFAKRMETGDGKDSESYILMGCPADEVEQNEAEAMDNYLLMDFGYDNNKKMDFAVFHLRDNSLVFATDRIADGSHPFDVGPADLTDGDGSWKDVSIGGVVHDCYSRIIDDEAADGILIAGIAHREYSYAMDGRNYSYVYFLSPLFLLLCILLISYGYHLERKGKNSRLGRGLFPAAMVICTVLYVSVSYFLVSLRQVTEAVYVAESGLQLLAEKTAEFNDRQMQAVNYYKNKDITSTKVIAYSIEYSWHENNYDGLSRKYYRADENGEYRPVKDSYGNDIECFPESGLLKSKQSIMDASRIWVVNENGYAVASSSDRWNLCLSEMENEEQLRKVMFHEQDYLYEFVRDEDGKPVCTRIAYPIDLGSYSSGGHTRYASYDEYLEIQARGTLPRISDSHGLLIIEVDGKPKALQMMDTFADETIQAALDDIGCSFVRISDPDENGYCDRKIRLCEDMNVDLSNLEIPSEMQQKSFNFIREISQTKYFIHMERDNVNHRHVALVFEDSYVHSDRMAGVVFNSILSFLGFFILMLLVKGTHGADDYMKDYKGRLSSMGNSKSSQLLKRFVMKRPEEKLIMVQQTVLTLFILFIIILFSIRSGNSHDHFFTDIYSSTFERAVNFYNISAALGILMAIMICFSLIKKVIDLVCDPLGEKFETYATLTVTIFQYLLLFCGMFYGAYLLGMDVKSIGALATVTAGAIGLGSREIIADIAAGIQIVAGGKVVLGDLIKADDFTGVVKEIRLRCCMLENKEGMIKSVPNSKMTSVVMIERHAGKQ